MNIGSESETSMGENLHPHCIALQTMKERCQQLQTRLAAVEEENVHLRLECGKDTTAAVVRANGQNEKTVVQALQEKVEELTKQKSQLTHQVFMVAAENRQLWNRLTRLMRTNKSLGNHLTKISDTLKQHPSSSPSDVLSYSFRDVSNITNKNDQSNKYLVSTDNDQREQSLEEISLKLINSIMLEKSELEQQYAEMVEMQSSSDINLQNVGFTYPDNSETDSLEQLKQHDIRLSQTKEALLAEQDKLRNIMQNLNKLKKGPMCKACRKNAKKKMCQIGTQFNSDDSLREHGATQTSLPPSSTNSGCGSSENFTDTNKDTYTKICPLCGVLYGKSASFATFHEHVLNHFTEEEVVSCFELIH